MDASSSRYAEEDAVLVADHLRLEPDYDLTFRELPECHNAVCQARFGKPIDQMWMLQSFPNLSRNACFPSVTLWFRPPPGATHQVFSSGKVMIMGVYSPVLACCSYQIQRLEFIQRGRPDYPMYPIQLENQVYSFHAPFNIHIRDLKYEDALSFIAVPDMFPGAIYRMYKPPVAMLIFESGSIMILGVRDHAELTKALDIVWPIIEEHKYVPEAGDARKTKPSKGGKRGRGSFNSNDDGNGTGLSQADLEKCAKKAVKKTKYHSFRSRAEFEEIFQREFVLLKQACLNEAARRAKKKRKQEDEEKARPQMPVAPPSGATKLPAVREEEPIQDMPDLSRVFH